MVRRNVVINISFQADTTLGADLQSNPSRAKKKVSVGVVVIGRCVQGKAESFGPGGSIGNIERLKQDCIRRPLKVISVVS